MIGGVLLMYKILDVGCGNNKHPRAIGIDKSENTQADIIHDLNNFPWPLEDSSFDEIICNDVLEHLDNIIKVMEEIHRIGKAGAIVQIRVPHFSSSNSFNDITHKHLFGIQSFDGFLGENFTQAHYYSTKRFKKLSVKITFGKLYKLIGILANINPQRYEKYFAFIFPAGNIEFKFTVLK